MEDLAQILPLLLGVAWLLPLASFAVILFFGPWLGRAGVLAGWVASGAILSAAVLSVVALGFWLTEHPVTAPSHGAAHATSSSPPLQGGAGGGSPAAQAVAPLPTVPLNATRLFKLAALTSQGLHDAAHADPSAHEQDPGLKHEPEGPGYYAGNWYNLAAFGPLKLSIGYHIDALTVAMFVMVTIIATCIHFYATGYMHDELHEVTDHEVRLSDGHHLHRRGRYHRFFQYMSLFSFSMLGLVIAGNVLMVFVFWELVGICSYFLIGFYIERQSASNAANKAFIVNRVGDFGMIVGMMALWSSLGTFAFGQTRIDGELKPGIFDLVRPAEGGHAIRVPDGMIKAAAYDQIARGVKPTPSQIDAWRKDRLGYGLLIVAGLGIFCGCVGKSAQFPLHVWLPDAMEGPTPVSALVHSATMVAAGVYLVARFYPVFTPEVLLVIAYTGAITLFLAATIAITATDIKRVLAYSTISQLGYMMLGLGAGGWLAGVLHLFTHAFFKSLLFLCSGSVIHAVHTNEMPLMGGLRKKMPVTAYTMLVGCLAIAGFGIPFVVGLSGYYSKDSIIAQLVSFRRENTAGLYILHGCLYYIAAGGAAITAFYMFRLWYLTFAGEPRDPERYHHAHEAPKVMYVPLIILASFAVAMAWHVPGTEWSLAHLLEQARPAGEVGQAVIWDRLVYPAEHLSHETKAIHYEATLVASATALLGFILATAFYGVRALNPDDARRQFAGIYRLLINKWWFDELYDTLFVRPVLALSSLVARIDKKVLDWFADSLALWTRGVSTLDDAIDRYFVDGLVNVLATMTYAVGDSLRGMQTGRLREYVMFIVVGTVALFVLATFALSYALAGG